MTAPHDLQARARAAAAAVLDPELPVLTIEDLGVLRDVRAGEDGAVVVVLTPTYSGCPAVEAIARDVREAVRRTGVEDVEVRTALAPAWTTDWISAEGRRKLAGAGIAPPRPAARAGQDGPVPVQLAVRCPRCGSPRTRELSRFGSTACKALWACSDCREPFDRVKELA